MKSLFILAWRNMWRQRRRSLITASALSVGMAMCMASICLQTGMMVDMKRTIIDEQIGHAQAHHPDYPGKQSMYDTIGGAAQKVEALKAQPVVDRLSARLRGQALVGDEEISEGVSLIGIIPEDEDATSSLGERISEGRMLSGEPYEMLMGSELAEILKVSIGEERLVLSQSAMGMPTYDMYKVVGLVKTGNTMIDRRGAYVLLADLQYLLELPDQVHEITLLTLDREQIPALVTGARDLLGEEAWIRPWQEVDPSTAGMFQLQDSMGFIVIFIVFGVAALGVLNTMMMSVYERTHELGVMRALGVRPSRLILLVIIECLMMVSLSAIGGLALGGALDYYLVTTGLDFSTSTGEGLSFEGITMDPFIKGQVEIGPIIEIIMAAYVVGFFAALWPAWRASQLRPVDAMREV